MPSVGEIVGEWCNISTRTGSWWCVYVLIGGSMRIYIQELLEAYEHKGIDLKPYCWFTDEQRYETSQHGGYGLGVLGGALIWRPLSNSLHLWWMDIPSKNARSSQSVFIVYSIHDLLVSDILIPAGDVHIKIHLDANTTWKILVHSQKIKR